jgi:hypothetical protein
VHTLLDGTSGVMVGIDKRGVNTVPLQAVWENKKEIDWELVEIAKVLAI